MIELKGSGKNFCDDMHDGNSCKICYVLYLYYYFAKSPTQGCLENDYYVAFPELL